jgi:hypothetical protein
MVNIVCILINAVNLTAYIRAGEPFTERVPKFLVIFGERLSRAHGNFEQQNMVLESCIIIITILYMIIILL